MPNDARSLFKARFRDFSFSVFLHRPHPLGVVFINDENDEKENGFNKEHDIAQQHDKIKTFNLLKIIRKTISFSPLSTLDALVCWLTAELAQKPSSGNAFSWIKQSPRYIYSGKLGWLSSPPARRSTTPGHVIGSGWCQMTQHKIKYCAIIHRWYSKIHRISYFNAGINLWYSWLLCCAPALLSSPLALALSHRRRRQQQQRDRYSAFSWGYEMNLFM